MQKLAVQYGTGVTRKERQSECDHVEELKGPVLLPKSSHVCQNCKMTLDNGTAPQQALANGLWIGGTCARTLISRVNHNRCVVRVKGSLQICHTIPMPKVYNALPPSPEELDEVLAYIYIGPTKPLAKEHHRTPLLVRHNKVANALEWLKLNHIDYADLTISYKNLNMYSEDSPPVIVDYHPGDGGKDEEAKAANDTDDNEGTTEGPCPFVVHGLMSTNALRAYALQYFKNKKNMALAAMFPWLFPYGLGGPGNARGYAKVSEAERKHQLLMYHDKRFQFEQYFPLVAFNHEQIKNSTTGGFLLAEQQKFPDIAKRILSIDESVLAHLTDKLKDGHHYKPETQAEKDCYQLIQDIDHVAHKVQGSLTNRKYMRNEIWALTSYLGAPSWFITFAPADVKHPLCLYFADTNETYKPELVLDSDQG
ncbi:uncharacterized protein C8Q71DRAFT_798816 [Rhodofomes roseus]|uniref:Helitron helicase-like domain-containing protein n=1 Tax=Rhodofomes roseus TaxID=34475 RepID=A0ABQ8K4A1_9APHY|nr:uncharacterized protein C8Q71DRAFT_798816 [Rhodofomes roseus]KAH9831729.1 hypothetical protein C8Q71DRAFT_798816 [Rhodofomes roseus]